MCHRANQEQLNRGYLNVMRLSKENCMSSNGVNGKAAVVIPDK